ncbi:MULTISPECIES: hypothetical protein [Cupriavidus]
MSRRSRKTSRRWLALTLAGAMSCMAAAHAQSTGRADASGQVSAGAASILAAPLVSVVGGGGGPVKASALAGMGSMFVVTGIVQGGQDVVEVILDAASGAGKLSVKLGKSAFETLGVSAGATVRAVAESTGTMLVASGKVLAFIPNTLGEALLHHERVPGAPAQ